MKHESVIEEKIIDGQWQPSRTIMADGWYAIGEIDEESFAGCPMQPEPLEAGEIREVHLEDVDYARTDAARGGLLTHSPYCPHHTGAA